MKMFLTLLFAASLTGCIFHENDFYTDPMVYSSGVSCGTGDYDYRYTRFVCPFDTVEVTLCDPYESVYRWGCYWPEEVSVTFDDRCEAYNFCTHHSSRVY